MELFEEHSDDLDSFFLMLQQRSRTTLHERESVITSDEVQHHLFERQMIKHFVADGRCGFIETGSLIYIKQNVFTMQIPSEERHPPGTGLWTASYHVTAGRSPHRTSYMTRIRVSMVASWTSPCTCRCSHDGSIRDTSLVNLINRTWLTPSYRCSNGRFQSYRE